MTMKRGSISDRIAVGGQPTEDDLKALKADGFVGIVNLRRDGEQNQPMSPAEEGLIAAAQGFQYVHIPVNSSDPKREQVDAVRAALGAMTGKVFVHCQGGGRACTMALLASQPNADPDRTMKQAETAGFPITNPVSVQFVADVLRSKL